MRLVTSSACLFSLALASCAANGDVGDWDSGEPSLQRLTLLVGQRSLDSDDFEPVDDQPLCGVELSDGGEDANIGYEFGVTVSSDSQDVFFSGLGVTEVTGTMAELYIGVRKEFPSHGVRPFMAAGLSAARGELEVGPNSADDTIFGFYVHGGLIFPVSDVLSIVADLRARFGEEFEVNGVEGDGDFVTIGFGLAFGI